MKNYQSFGFLASIVFAVGMVGFNLSDGTFGTNQEEISPMASTAGMVGHIEAIHTDSQGNIISYVQTDNAITNKGINCTLAKVFGISYDASHCPADPGTYNHIGLVNATIDGEGLNINATSGSLLYPDGASNGLGPASDSTITFNTVASGGAAGAGDQTRGTDAEVLISTAFTSTGDSHAVVGATLQNGTENAGIFAYKDFPSSITLNNGDTLTVNWQIGMTGTVDESQ